MQNEIKKVCVIGSGVMGSGIAALIANSSHKVVLLDIIAKDSDDPNKIVKTAKENLHKQKPPPLSFPDKVNFITIGNLEHDLELIRDCDLVIEVIVEKLEIKHQLYNKIIPYLKEDAIIASNTSTLPLKRLKENLPDNIKSRFVITHFFNPPRYMELLELIIDSMVKFEVIERVSGFLTKTLGKTIVKCNDTPGFIANRVGCFLLELVARKAISQKLDFVALDKIFTICLGLPSTGIFGLYDLIGHDVMKLISSSLLAALPANDAYHKIYVNTPVLDKMIEKKLIGRKGEGGFYRLSVSNGKKIKEVININDLSYSSVQKVDISFNNLDELLVSDSVYGKIFTEIITEFYVYLASLVPSVTDNIYDIDAAMKLGYSWKYGPFELLTIAAKDGWNSVIKNADLMHIPLPQYLGNKEYQKIDKQKFNSHKDILQESQIVLENDSAKLINYRENFIFVITTKMNCLNHNVFYLLQEAASKAEKDGKNLYIYPQGNNFSAGADLKLLLSYIEDGNFHDLENLLKLGQQTMLHLKYSGVHIISCAKGVALGGGCELLLYSSYIVANQELNAGLVELGVGLIPGWGGVTEMFVRSKGDKTKLIRNVRNIIEQNKTSSADYFKSDYDVESMHVNMNKHYILDEALKLNLSKKIVPIPHKITLPKINLATEIDTSKYNDLQNKVLSKFQNIIDKHPDTNEEELLGYEREIFLELAKDPKTIEKLKAIVK
ncbi:enoyl-CoA hydratase/isomerase family protein [Rickettsia felis str. Pedreira]|uniref:Putative fatty acid oxidation complex trifunctional enzyme n=2 Tax=Rickettsia felis TaxID=42862 RepID=FAD3_RICFE|nr:3-hydroxyacyl-CoA dehydrogenase/enoyl-CoA hydratase family protein [Rickettsia felis]Q4UL32.1 RecName: Full=Putative fatty acid oxidation complex trifunctional enzyme; Includes: RecName: Full=3-hydroxyacyl-CoA dehydrogenase; Includes: RecName: Full=Enoyl-CoA hydratase/Delta(3)-cis-Delta(2)-trans-enoyl-CoA isomerase [Rickettsia felis URRWXCal2]AAY61741.1 3-hydroxyacyl-CoA dehydrogenase FadB [Rickettsia felis URRWXCal2]KHO03497.1 enoyl-CoA hydratase [Rickettsia felis]KJV59168.1 enoyl-CoA hydra